MSMRGQRNHLSDRDLIARARHAHAHITRVGNTIWACQIEDLVNALADRVERLTMEPETVGEARVETEQPWLFAIDGPQLEGQPR